MKSTQAKARAAERRALERAILRTLRNLWIRDKDAAPVMSLGLQGTLVGLEIARRAVGK